MRKQKHYRLATPQTLAIGGELQLSGNAAHYLSHVLRLKPGDGVLLFNQADGEWAAEIVAIGKRDIALRIAERTRPPEQGTGLTVCFAPIKGGRLETIIEKATELGADIIQPVLTSRSVVDKVNIERADAIAREAAEQCERLSWPEIREPVKLLTLLGNWPENTPLVYGDESGQGIPITQLMKSSERALNDEPLAAGVSEAKGGQAPLQSKNWAILAGPEGGFTPEEFTALSRVKSAQPVSLGPRILRADTAIITLCVATLMAWGDWHRAPRFEG